MAWDDELVAVVRVMVNDPDSATFSENSLINALLVAAMQVKHELALDVDYAINVSNQTLSPDPTLAATLDESFSNLMCLKAACIVDRGAAILAAKQAIRVRDGSSSIDLTGALTGKLRLLEKGGWCSAYQDAKLDYQRDRLAVAGQAVLGPFRMFARNNAYRQGPRGNW